MWFFNSIFALHQVIQDRPLSLNADLHDCSASLHIIHWPFLKNHWCFDLNEGAELAIVVFNYNLSFAVSLNVSMASTDGDVSNSQIIIMASSHFQRTLLVQIQDVKSLWLCRVWVWILTRNLNRFKNNIVRFRFWNLKQEVLLVIEEDAVLVLGFAEFTMKCFPWVADNKGTLSHVFLARKPSTQALKMNPFEGTTASAHTD